VDGFGDAVSVVVLAVFVGPPAAGSMAPRLGGLGRVAPVMSVVTAGITTPSLVVNPGRATPAPLAGLLEDGWKSKLSNCDSACK